MLSVITYFNMLSICYCADWLVSWSVGRFRP